ncbi:MAG: 30S ribosomal protein S18 [Dehalococcoidia bacterium]|nr:30S ribosomal protein S18 [Dehalococcoidia bacterium]
MTTNRQNSRRNNFSYDFRARKKPISKVIKGLPVDYKDVDVLLSYISDRAKISSSYRTGNAAKDHRSLTKAIKRARHMALLPISHEHDIVRTSIEETVAEETSSEETVAEETSSEETVAEETSSEETVAEETSTEETVAEDESDTEKKSKDS